MFSWLGRLLGRQVTDADVLDRLDQMEEMIEELSLENETARQQLRVNIIELYDLIDAQLTPIQKRISSRVSKERKAQEEDLNTSTPITGGIIRDTRMLRQYGINK